MNKKIREATTQEISVCMKNNAIKTISSKRKDNIYKDINEDTGEVDIYNKYQIKQALSDNLGLEFRLYESNRKRREKIKARITRMLDSGKALFLTLTFSDKMFARGCSTETRRTYIRRFLKEQCFEYIANIDFGSTNQREHYHAVVVPKTIINFARYREIFDSNINAKPIRVNETSIRFVGMYINKLTNHALKENGFYKRLIFSRDLKPSNHLS